MSNIYLLIYIGLWLITLFFYQKKKQHIDAGSVLIFSFLIYSVASFITFNSFYSSSRYHELHLFPFLYLYIMLMFVMFPVLKYKDKSIDYIQKPNNVLLMTIALIYIISTLIHFLSKITDIYDGVIRIINDPMGGMDIYRDTMDNSFNIADGIIENIFAILSNIFSDIGILIFFYYLTFKNKNKYIILGFLFSIFISILSSIAQSQRGPAVDRLLTVIIAFYALKEYIPYSINKRIKKIGIFVILFFTVPIIAITISRFGDSDIGTEGSFYSYIGQQNLNFNNYAFDNGGLRYGDRTFPLFKRILGFDNVPINFWERRIKYPNLKINDETFIGFIGDFLLDFGPYIATIIFIVFTINAIYRTRINNRILLFHQLILLYFIMCVCIQGGIKLYSFSDTGGNLRIIVYIIVYFAFKLDYKNSLNYQKQIKVY